MGRIARAMAHDLNNFLSAIAGSAELLERQLGTDNPLIDEIREASAQASSLTQQVMRLTESPPSQSERASAETHRSDLSSRPETILVVLHQPSIRVLVSQFLSEDGYRVLQASGAETASEVGRMHEGRIDAVLVELELPSCPGPELVARLAEGRGAVPAIYLAEPGASPGDAGDRVIPKPLKPVELERELERLFRDVVPDHTA